MGEKKNGKYYFNHYNYFHHTYGHSRMSSYDNEKFLNDICFTSLEETVLNVWDIRQVV